MEVELDGEVAPLPALRLEVAVPGAVLEPAPILLDR